MTAHGKQGFQGWCTPESVLKPIREFAPIDLDPCSNEHSTVGAKLEYYDKPGLTSGLEADWHLAAHTFVNPPYGRGEQIKWVTKAFVEHKAGAKHITMLIPAAVETKLWRQVVWQSATAVAFWNNRIRFERHDGVADTGNKLPSALVYWGCDLPRFVKAFAPHATVVTAWTAL